MDDQTCMQYLFHSVENYQTNNINQNILFNASNEFRNIWNLVKNLRDLARVDVHKITRFLDAVQEALENKCWIAAARQCLQADKEYRQIRRYIRPSFMDDFKVARFIEKVDSIEKSKSGTKKEKKPPSPSVNLNRMRQNFRNQQINKHKNTTKFECNPTKKCDKSKNDSKQEVRENFPTENNSETNAKDEENVLDATYSSKIKKDTNDNHQNGIDNKSSIQSNDAKNVNGKTDFDDNSLNAERHDIKEVVPQTNAEDEPTSDRCESQNDIINGNIENNVGNRPSKQTPKQKENDIGVVKFEEAKKQTLNVDSPDRIEMPQKNKVEDESSTILSPQIGSVDEEINGNVSNYNDTTNDNLENTSDNETSKRDTEEDDVNVETCKSKEALEGKVEGDHNKCYQNEKCFNESENIALLRNDTKQEPTANTSDLSIDVDIAEQINPSSSLIVSGEHPISEQNSAENIEEHVPKQQNKGRQAEASPASNETAICLRVIDVSTLVSERITEVKYNCNADQIVIELTTIYETDWIIAYKSLTDCKPSNGIKNSIDFLGGLLKVAALDVNEEKNKRTTLQLNTNVNESLTKVKEKFFRSHLKNLQTEHCINYSSNADGEHNVNVYSAKCVELAWFMYTRQPPMAFDYDSRPMLLEDLLDIFKPYKNKGNFIQYVVWPAIRLCAGGEIVANGIAEFR